MQFYYICVILVETENALFTVINESFENFLIEGVLMDVMNNPFLLRLDRIVETILKHKKISLSIFAGILLAIGFFFGYRIYRQRAQIAAHHDFMYGLKHYDASIVKQKFCLFFFS